VGDSDAFEEWFLTVGERGNPATAIDRANGDRSWTEGNDVSVLVDGSRYFPVLLEELERSGEGDWIYLSDLQGDGDERLGGSGSEVGAVLAAAARRGAQVRGLLWRSHPIGHAAAEVKNLGLSRTVNEAGGEVVLDHRVRRQGSHHQKIVVIHRGTSGRGDDDVAFVGGIDLAHGRNDGPPHAGDPQPTRLSDEHYGERPPWHDVQLRIRGPAVSQVSRTFLERWMDPNPLDRRTPMRALRNLLARTPAARGELAPPERVTSSCGPHAVQVLRTYPAKRPPYPFALRGERSVARAYVKALGKAQRFIYLEDQYLWSLDATTALCAALRAQPELRCVVVIPRYPDPAGMLGDASRFGRWRVEAALVRAGGDRVAIYDLENDQGVPIYVHAKVCMVDDVWMTVGSDNLNRRSWTHDSEICCAVMDGTGALPRDTRLRLAREHLDLDDAPDGALVDVPEWFDALRDAAHALDRWHRDGGSGPRPRGRLRVHPTDRPARVARPLLHRLHAWLLDPDGRPRDLRYPGRY
jgi:phosphatidylserine/phosphatidylglycerophosphate/cardiolipin synthase-like enzyme